MENVSSLQQFLTLKTVPLAHTMQSSFQRLERVRNGFSSEPPAKSRGCWVPGLQQATLVLNFEPPDCYVINMYCFQPLASISCHSSNWKLILSSYRYDFLFYLFIIYVYVCAPTWIYITNCVQEPIQVQERHQIPWSWSYIQAIVSSLVWVLETEVGSSTRAETADRTEPSLQHQEFFFLKDSRTEELKKRHESLSLSKRHHRSSYTIKRKMRKSMNNFLIMNHTTWERHATFKNKTNTKSNHCEIDT